MNDTQNTLPTHAESLRSEFDRWSSAKTDDRIFEFRKKNLESFLAEGFPTTKLEDFKYTSFRNLSETQITLPDSQMLGVSDFGRLPLDEKTTLRICLQNGALQNQEALQKQDLKNWVICSIEEAFSQHAELIDRYAKELFQESANPLIHLNNAFLKNGLFVFVPENLKIEQKIAIELGYLPEPDSLNLIPSQCWIIAGKNSHVSIIEHSISTNDTPYFSNHLTKVILETNSSLTHYRVQNESKKSLHFWNLSATQKHGSTFDSHLFSFGSKLARQEVETRLLEENSACRLGGLYLAGSGQHSDQQTKIDHAAPHCTSEELYQGILEKDALAVFNGKIIVRPHASKTVSKQMNKNLLLSNDAQVNSRPVLEIDHNDVKCTHGATIGKLDLDQLFYLQSRGFTPTEAQHLLTYAFVGDLMSAVTADDLRTYLEKELFTHFVGNT